MNNNSTNTSPQFVTFMLTLLPYNMPPVTLAELSQNSARIYSFKLSARVSSERLNSVSTQDGPKKSRSSSSKETISTQRFACRKLNERSRS